MDSVCIRFRVETQMTTHVISPLEEEIVLVKQNSDNLNRGT